jgi:hypothetical protein
MANLNTHEALLEEVRALRAALDRDVAEAGDERITQPNTFDEWSFKDVIGHLTDWRMLTAARLEAAQHGGEPTVPGPGNLNEEDEIDEINRWFFEQNRKKSVAEVLRESNDTFDRVEKALAALPEEDLFTKDRFPWLEGYALAAVIEGTSEHYRVDHEPAIRAWLAKE